MKINPAIANKRYQSFYKEKFEYIIYWHLQNKVEQGAINSALHILTRLEKHNIYPPMITTHGGDAIVFLWAGENKDVFALTITEGECSIIIRQNFKEIRRVYSIRLRV